MSQHSTASVLFADISGFTAISEKLDPEEVTALVNRCFECLEGIVIAHGGTVNKYLGDCVLAVFRGGEGGTEGAGRAVDAAVEIRLAIQQLNRELKLGMPLGVHAGIGTGPVVAGEIGGRVRRELGVAGDAVTMASRLEDHSESGQILVDPRTRDATAADMIYREAESVAVRDGMPPEPVFELTGIRSSHARVKRKSERRHAAVLFAEMSWFASAAERLSTDAAMSLLNRCFAELEDVVKEHGGVIDKFIGNSLMALFGVPNAIENAPQEAVNAAIELRNRLARFAAEEGVSGSLDMHIGVNSGLMIAGEIGGRINRSYTVMGDAVNLASRLKDAAPAGAIYVGPAVHRATGETFAYRALAPLRVKGKAEPVPAFEVLSRHEHLHRTRTGPADHLSSPLVGREGDLQQLRDLLAGVATGRGAIVSLTGEAGVGKSRLAAELVADAAARHLTVLEGRATSMGRNLSYHPFIDLFRRWAGIGEEDDEDAAREHLERAVTEQLRERAEEVFPYLATMMGIGLSRADAERIASIHGDALERLISRSVRDLLQSLATARPVLLLLDDLHWADQTSLRLLESVLRLTPEQPILLLQVFRPEHAEAARHCIETASPSAAERYGEIVLGPLTEHQSSALIENLLQVDGLPPTARRLITERADGNPFYIEEVVRSLIDQGAIERARGRYRFTAKLETVNIPHTIEEVIMARVDRLAESTRHLLQVASVIGRSFQYRLLTEILRAEGELAEEFDRELALLQKKQLLVQRRSGWEVAVGPRSAGDELEYLFAHAVAQQTIYESILQRTRKELHALVATTTERVFEERLADFHGMLAYHYSQAEDLAKAEEYLFKAGETAARAAASREALNYFQEASRLYLLLHPDGGELHKRMLLEKKIAVALWNIGDLAASIERFDTTLEHLGDRRRRSALAANLTFAADAVALLYRLYRGPARNDRDLERVREIANVSYMKGRAQTTADPVRVFMDSVHGMRWLNRSDPARIDQACGMYATMAAFLAYSGLGAARGISFALSRRCLAHAEQVRRPNNIPDAFAFRSMRFVAEYLAGNWGELESIDDQLVGAALQHGMFWDVQTYFDLDADRLARQGEFARAARRHDQLRALAEAYGYEFARSAHDFNFAWAMVEQSRLAEARAAAERYYQRQHDPPLRLLGASQLAKIHLLLDERPAAESYLTEASQVVRRTPTMPPWHLNFYAVATLLHAVNELETAAAPARGARRRWAAEAKRRLRFARTVGAQVRTQRTEIFQLAGRLEWCLGRPGAARRAWAASIREGLRLGARPQLARTYLEAGVRLVADGRRLEVEGLGGAALLERARALFGELELDQALRQLGGLPRAA